MELHSLYSIYVSVYLALACIKSSEFKPLSSLKWKNETQVRIEAIKKAIMGQRGLESPHLSGMNISRSEEEEMYKLYLERVRQSSQNTGLWNKRSTRIHSVNSIILKGKRWSASGVSLLSQGWDGAEEKCSRWLMFSGG